uniref:Uncharacterized protein n=1 Tax=Spongospora subterranea TaxID=70186 RepID=A0A0H5QSC3_9EUKA|eukprot:CRZ04923.1 hypothetical protein [Spongospora subterranea]
MVRPGMTNVITDGVTPVIMTFRLTKHTTGIVPGTLPAVGLALDHYRPRLPDGNLDARLWAITLRPETVAAGPDEADDWRSVREQEFRFADINTEFLLLIREINLKTNRPQIRAFAKFRERKAKQTLVNQFYPFDIESIILRAPWPEVMADLTKDNVTSWQIVGVPPSRARNDYSVTEDEKWPAWEKAAAENRFHDIDEVAFLKFSHGFKKIYVNSRKSIVLPPLATLQNIWISGDFDAEVLVKSFQNDDVYRKDTSESWYGYSGQPVVLIDGLMPSECKALARSFRLWSDRNAFRAKLEHGDMMIRPRHLIVLSKAKIEQCFTERDDTRRLKRLFSAFNADGFNERSIVSDVQRKLNLWGSVLDGKVQFTEWYMAGEVGFDKETRQNIMRTWQFTPPFMYLTLDNLPPSTAIIIRSWL